MLQINIVRHSDKQARAWKLYIYYTYSEYRFMYTFVTFNLRSRPWKHILTSMLLGIMNWL